MGIKNSIKFSSAQIIKFQIRESFDTCERVADAVLKWEERREDILPKIIKKIESKGDSTFSRLEKIVISEWLCEFGQPASKIVVHIRLLETLLDGPISFDHKKYPRFIKYLATHRFNPPLDITWK